MSIESFSVRRLTPGGALCGGLVFCMGIILGVLAWGQFKQPTQIWIPSQSLHASGSMGFDSVVAATGLIDTDVEGLYTVDALTGDLQCSVLYVRGVRAQHFGAVFKTNVIQDLGIQQTKKPRYLLVTGQTQFQRGAGVARPALSVAYVIDANTGNFAAYGVPWNPSAAGRGQPQEGQLVLLSTGSARTTVIRE